MVTPDLNILLEESNMLAPQSVDPTEAVMVFEGLDVLKDSDQTRLSDSHTTRNVIIGLTDITDGSDATFNLPMTYRAATDLWTIPVAGGLANYVTIGHKYAGLCKDSSAVMRRFYIREFSVDDKMLEKTVSSLGYELDFTGTTSKMVWSDAGGPAFEAPIYEGGSGTGRALSPAEVTHRGPITKI